MTATRDKTGAAGGRLGDRPIKQAGAPGSHPSHGPQAGLQAPDLQTVTNPEKGRGHVDKVMLCTLLLHFHEGLPPSVLLVISHMGWASSGVGGALGATADSNQGREMQ